jgi:hypothetical protein
MTTFCFGVFIVKYSPRSACLLIQICRKVCLILYPAPGLEQRNTQILELYLLLHKIQLYRGMDILKQYVPPKHHLLVRYFWTNLSFL